MNKEKIKTHTETNDTMGAVLLCLATRPKATLVTNLTRFKRYVRTQGFTLSDRDYNLVWDMLSLAGYGDIIKTERGRAFRWATNFKRLAAELLPTNARPKMVEEPKAEALEGEGLKAVHVPLATGVASVMVPKGLTHADVKELTAVLVRLAG